jgi:hypothetical protein
LFVRPITESQLFDQQYPCVGHSLEIQTVFEKSQKIIEGLFEIKLNHQLSPAGVPFFFHNSTVRSMISDIEARTKQAFSTWFQSQPDLTEFMLYSGFVLYQHQNFDFLYNQDKCYTRSINIAHCEVDSFEKKFAEMQTLGISTVSVHRHAWSHLSLVQQQMYLDFLRSKELLCEL